MPLQIVRDDITTIPADAIVNAANSFLLGGGGVDGAIHRAAGAELLDECRTLGGCEVGQAKITKGYNLPADYIIHTVGPIWRGGKNDEEKLLGDCYRSSLALAQEYKLESIAFPLISSGAFGYPPDAAMKVATTVITDFLEHSDMTVIMVIYDKGISHNDKRFVPLKRYIDEWYFDSKSLMPDSFRFAQAIKRDLPESFNLLKPSKNERRLENIVKQAGETFSQMLLRLIEQKNMSEVETYKRANIDRKLFSKIRSDVHYRPRKQTVIAFAIALRLNIDETKDLLLKAGFALSPSSVFDIIIQYFIEEGNYNIFEINEALFAFEQNILGA